MARRWSGSRHLHERAKGSCDVTKRREKKSESLEIRLPYSQKQAFMEACRERGVTASDTLRQFIADDLDALTEDQQDKAWTTTVKNNPFKTAAGVAATALAAAAFGTSASMANDTVFDRFDANDDATVTYGEFMAQLTPSDVAIDTPTPPPPSGSTQSEQVMETRVVMRGPTPPPAPRPGDAATELFRSMDQDGSGSLDANEFEADGTIVRRSDETVEINGKENRMIGLEITTYDVTEKGSISIGKSMLTKLVEPDAPDGVVEQAFRDLREELADMAAGKAPPPPMVEPR